MVTTSTNVGRAGLAHPDLGHDGGTGLWNKVNTMLTKISDSLTAQYFGEFTLAASASEDVVHNFGMSIGDLEVHIIESGVLISNEAQSLYGIVEKVGNLTNALTITNNTGGSKTFSVYVIGFNLDKMLGRQKARVATTDATVTILDSVQVPNNESLVFNCLVCGKKSDNVTAALFELKVLAENNAGTVTARLVNKLASKDDDNWDVTLTNDNAYARIRVTGVAATNIEWYSVIQKTYF